MPLDKQIQILNVDTGNFYSNKELYLHKLNHKVRLERNFLKKEIKKQEDELKEYGLTKEDLVSIQKGQYRTDCVVLDSLNHCVELRNEIDLIKKYKQYYDAYKHKTQKAKETKNRILDLLKNKVNNNIEQNGKHHVRKLRFFDSNGCETKNIENNIISVFDSAFTRTIGAEPDHLSKDFMVVQVYYFDILKDLIYHGFVYEGQKYIYFTSSAGQIRVKKAVFIKESVWKEHERTIMCGLTIDEINKQGGNNTNKFLAYLALSNSATDVWKEFNIDKSIVIDDFETDVYGTYDFIDDSDYSIDRKSGYIPVSHTDGCGMMLPNAFGKVQKNMMVRMPWVKGLLGVFDFKKFIEVNNSSSVIKDIYGVEHDVIAEDIQVIFCKSQFKLWKFYSSWECYKENYKKYRCTAGFANVEEERIKNTTINYQMLQSLTDVTDDEIKKLVEPSNKKLKNICTSLNTILDIFGATKYNKYKTPFQEALILYPNLLNDSFIKKKIRDIKNSLLKRYKAGKLDIYGKYTFILPDLYAACEFWFQNIKRPHGLLQNGEVFCNLFWNSPKLDCLRSPHLYCEHAVRNNIACKNNEDRRTKILEWFTTNALYTSSFDLISKILMFDVDGDVSLVIADETFVSIAERNTVDIVPLYYEMKKANANILNNENFYQGLVNAFTWGNIGIYSNNISKIWNSDVFITGTDIEKTEALNCIKLLCAENNYSIDTAKTLYMPKRPDYIHEKLVSYTKNKLPHFFIFAKDKTESQVESINNSFVNKISNYIINPKIKFLYNDSRDKGIILDFLNKKNILKRPDALLLLSENPYYYFEEDVIEKYKEICKRFYYKIDPIKNLNPELYKESKVKQVMFYRNAIDYVKKTLNETGFSNEQICDMLVLYVYDKKNKGKEILWTVYGDILLKNLKRNIGKQYKSYQTKIRQCIDCGDWFETSVFDSASCRCEKCRLKHKRKIDKERKQRQRKNNVTQP